MLTLCLIGEQASRFTIMAQSKYVYNVYTIHILTIFCLTIGYYEVIKFCLHVAT